MRAPLLAAVALAACGVDPPAAPAPADTGVTAPAVCDSASLPPRQLRLLTRREYTHTVNDLFGWSDEAAGGACEDLSDCAVGSQSCEAGVCQVDPCTRATFQLDGAGGAYDAVVVAGDFNGWASDPGDGGLALDYLSDLDLWVGKRDLDEGSYSYKLIVDGDWWTDPANPDTVDDGYGGRNSLVTVACSGGAGAVDWGADLPLDSRPEHHPFDNHADATLVTPQRAEALLDVAERISALALRDPDALLGCSPWDEPCVRAFVERLGRRALRRPLSIDEVDRYSALVAEQGGGPAGLDVFLQVLLSSPYFLYRPELGVPAGDGTWRLTGEEIASALSYFLWETAPDDALLAAAEAGALDSPEGIEAEARRLLADPRARRAVATFGEQWLGVERVLTMDKNDGLGRFDAPIRQALLAEVGGTLTHVVFDGSGQYTDLLTSGVYAQSDTLARFYGFDEGGLVDAEDEGRAGVLGMGAVLASTAHSDQTSPVRRGLFVRERLLCQTLGTPPANAGGVPDVDPDASTRDRFSQHSDDPACSGCHVYIDPVGFGFEHFDPLGRWRPDDHGRPIDAMGELWGVEGVGRGTVDAFGSLHGLGALLAQSEAAPRCFVRQTWRFAVGRDPEPGDCAIERLTAQFVAQGTDVQDLLLALVTAPEFTARQ